MGANLANNVANDIIQQNLAMSAYLEHTLDIASNSLRARLIIQGITTPTFLSAKPDSFVKDLCYIIRRQGGTSSYGLTHQKEERLLQFVRWCRYTELIQRPLDLANATEDGIQVLSEWMEQLPSTDDAELPDKFSDPSKIRNLLENIHSYLGMVKNKAGVPILYVIKEDPGLPAEDPGFGMPDFDSELKIRGRHNGVYWRSSNQAVWRMMRHICHGTVAWPFVSQYERSMNGRGAFLAFSQHYMGTDIQHGIRTKAADVLQNSKFTGESKNFTFDKFSARLTKAFNDSRPMPDEDKVIKLLNAFQVPELAWAKGTISSSAQYRTNYDASVAFLAEQVRARKPSGTNPRHIASLRNTGKTPPKKRGKGKGKGKGKWTFDPKNPTRYCPPREYPSLPDDVKDKMREARKEKRNAASNAQLSELTSQIAAIKTALDKKADK